MIGFVHIEKTAGTSLKFVLRNTFGLRHCNLESSHADAIARRDDLELARRVHVFGLRCISGHGLVQPTANLGSDIGWFTILRDPEARCLSHFLHHKRAAARYGRTLSFAQFMADERQHDVQVRMIAGGPDLERARHELAAYFFVGLTEHFPESLVALDRLAPMRLRLEIQRLHVTPNVDDRHEVLDDPAARAMLTEHNRLDQALYDHVASTVFPGFLEAAGVALGSVDPGPPERDHRTLRYWLNRWFQKGVYRPLARRRRRRRSQA